jgi:hypothetical protein
MVLLLAIKGLFLSTWNNTTIEIAEVYKAGGEKVDKKTKICEHWEQRFV